ncbi:Cytochrome c oxidase subunit 6A, mitochondrial [Pichia californica]|uniref:Cytochrome c oxidase subunit 6A, mitochondrial n=1 Tax=Pichia californica TaxID=460514 RepID=A0A9P6WRN5_9ASCO|nr:Cytochrome c oxidase subunit 6A, mitochondrial [[Candida] californica]KAG0691193.1 Cytochrome c oxidase subunit 6A, mitochondrial [[Candida] californica]
MFRTVAKRQAKTIGRRFQSNLDKPAFSAPDLAKGAEFVKHTEAVVNHANSSSSTWKKLSLFLAAPIILATAVNTVIVEKEHAEHREHSKHLSDEEWPVPKYPYLNIRRVDFFWGDGDKTLFWNSDCNRHIK